VTGGRGTRVSLAALVKTRLRQMQYRPGLLEGFLAKPGLDLAPLQ
jgi:putative transposase